MKTCTLILFNILASVLIAQNGPFEPAAGEVGSSAIHKDSSIFISWAQEAEFVLGYQDINAPELGMADFGTIEDVTGFADNLIMSLGDSGQVTYVFSNPILNGPGADFAIFENSFDNTFLEFAFVEVSSDGTNFFRFPATCLIQDTIQTGPFGTSDPTMVNNLAGKYKADYGTPFDLEDMTSFDFDNNNIVAIRIIDVIGNISGDNISVDNAGQTINDPYPTLYPSSGFDLDALGIIHVATDVNELTEIQNSVYPNPSNGNIEIEVSNAKPCKVSLFDITGKLLLESAILNGRKTMNLSAFDRGVYLLRFNTESGYTTERIILN